MEERAAMLPETLQRAKRPPEALLGEPAKRVGCFRVSDRLVGVRDRVAAASNRQREILVLRQRVLAEATGLLHERLAPGTDRARHDGDAVEERECAAIEILARHVLDRLPARDEVHAVADLCVP